MLIIGDVHGKVLKYQDLIRYSQKTYQLGDFGFKTEHDWHLQNVDDTKHKVLFGNHDYYPYLNREHSVTSNFIIESGILFIRGAYSIDKVYRTEGRDWFNNEQMSYEEGLELIDYIESLENKPNIIVSHDCPFFLYERFFGIRDGKNLTNQVLQRVFEIMQPDKWIFGHHHKRKQERINGTQFTCLEECGFYSL